MWPQTLVNSQQSCCWEPSNRLSESLVDAVLSCAVMYTETGKITNFSTNLKIKITLGPKRMILKMKIRSPTLCDFESGVATLIHYIPFLLLVLDDGWSLFKPEFPTRKLKGRPVKEALNHPASSVWNLLAGICTTILDFKQAQILFVQTQEAPYHGLWDWS